MTPMTNGRACRYVDVVGLWCALGYAALTFLARQPGEPDLPVFFLFVAWTSLPVFSLYLYCHRRGEPFPLGRLIFWAVVFRICGLAGGPFYEDDFYRYLWDGYRFATTGTPYGAVPETFFSDPGVPAVFRGILDRINYPELPTIYAPVTQVVFLFGYWLKPGSVIALQAILSLVDLATIALLLRLAPTGNVMLYAWCPLVVKEVAFTAHPDGIGVCLLLAAIVLARKHRWWGAAVCLGMAVGTKIFALVLVPLVLVGAGFGYWVLFVVTLSALYAPFILQGGAGFDSLLVFAREWEFNSAAFGLFTTVLQPFGAKLVLGLVCAAFWGHYYFRYSRSGDREIPRGDWLYGIFLMASPVINPWYLLWLLPFAAITPSVSVWTASIAVFLAYVTGLNLNDGNLQPYQQPVWVRPLEFGLILLALAYDWFRQRSIGLGNRANN
ncbi:MAG: hypothetical protein F4090_07260 [Nitrospira sp. SB0672_bin_25]|nr:hypothetical protein [Nitrospira sp. SB0678_bin_10]MYJ54680.1 hypothetical protein [Nitrospira sp. SB0672_bin_25]